MEAVERVQDAGCEDVGLNPALCSAPGGRQGHRGAEPSPASRSSQAGETQYGRCFPEQGVHREGRLSCFKKEELEIDICTEQERPY